MDIFFLGTLSYRAYIRAIDDDGMTIYYKIAPNAPIFRCAFDCEK